MKIRELGYDVDDVSEVTGFPEAPSGLLKTLHPRIHGGFLLDPGIPDQKEYMAKHGIEPIHVLVSNLYPFEEAVQRETISLREAAKHIDIGGPTLIRSGAKAALLRGDVLVITNPNQYKALIEELEETHGEVKPREAMRLATQAFERTKAYDEAIHRFLFAQEQQNTVKEDR